MKDLFEGMTNERARELLGELSLNQLTALLMSKCNLERLRVNIQFRPMESRVRVKKGKKG